MPPPNISPSDIQQLLKETHEWVFTAEVIAAVNQGWAWALSIGDSVA